MCMFLKVLGNLKTNQLSNIAPFYGSITLNHIRISNSYCTILLATGCM